MVIVNLRGAVYPSLGSVWTMIGYHFSTIGRRLSDQSFKSATSHSMEISNTGWVAACVVAGRVAGGLAGSGRSGFCANDQLAKTSNADAKITFFINLPTWRV